MTRGTALPASWRPFPRQALLQAKRAAPRLLGAILASRTPEGWLAGRILETEAYLAQDDPGSHSRSGPTPRCAPMFEAAGTWYVYRIYGLHHCVNVVTGPKGSGEAVLIRALEPLIGRARMCSNRELAPSAGSRDLLGGPGKLAQALALGLELNGEDACGSGNVRLLRDRVGAVRLNRVAVTRRIGLGPGRGEDLALRFVVRS